MLLGYEGVTQSRTEALVAEVYDQQLGSLLYAVNQHAYAVLEAERAALEQALHTDGVLAETGRADAATPLAHAMAAVGASPVLETAHLYLKDAPRRSVYQGASGRAASDALAGAADALERARAKLARRMQEDAGYLPIEPFDLEVRVYDGKFQGGIIAGPSASPRETRWSKAKASSSASAAGGRWNGVSEASGGTIALRSAQRRATRRVVWLAKRRCLSPRSPPCHPPAAPTPRR